MAKCTQKLSSDLLFDCLDKPMKGLAGSRAVIVNSADLDLTTLTQNGATISSLALQSGSTGFNVEWYKELASTGSEYTKSSEDVDGFKHSFLCRLATSTAANAESAAEIKDGRFVMIVETEYKGLDQMDAFKVYGIRVGMELAEMTGNSNENSGSLLYTLSTREGTFENYPYSIFNEGTYATSKAAFDSLFAVV